MNGPPLIALLLTSLAQAADQDQGGGSLPTDYCKPPGLVVHYGNGMFSTYANAIASREALEFDVGDDIKARFPDTPIRYEVRYNTDEQLLQQVVQAATQFSAETQIAILRILAGNAWGGELDDSVLSSVATWIADNLSDHLYTNNILGHASDITQMVGRYQQLNLEGNIQLLIAHSQGTWYANAAYRNVVEQLSETASFAMVFAGPAASEVADGGNYVLNSDDLIVARLLVGIGPSFLPTNANNNDDGADFTQHSFVESYLRGDDAGPKLKSHITNEVDTFKTLYGTTPLASQANPGEFVVTLTWPDGVDIDLHINEPSGDHVYYSVPQGTIGALDHDAVSTDKGIEHYFVDCGDLQAGTYDIGVNYYAGEGSIQTNVSIVARSEIKSYTEVLNEAQGSAGNSNPVMVARVTVQDDGTGQFSIDIQPL